jgi:hypothetical protein
MIPRCLVGAGARPRGTPTRSCCLSCWPPVVWTSCTCRCTRSSFARTCFKTGVLNLVYGPAESTGAATYEDAKVHREQVSATSPSSHSAAKPSDGLGLTRLGAAV